jgi:RHS repeat-associated protein
MYDGNGNVAGLVKASDGTVSANYEYGPFGETLRATGVEAREMPFRFSTKRTDSWTDLVLYEYRVYTASAGRWLSRDPVLERATEMLLSHNKRHSPLPKWKADVLDLDYGFAGNDAEDRIDMFGLCPAVEGNCGKDVTLGLKRTQADVRARFSNMGYWKRAANCQPWSPPFLSLTSAGMGVIFFRAMTGWDVNDMVWGWPQYCADGTCGTGPCGDTVHISQGQNACYLSWDVNYALFGWINQLCDNPEEGMVAMVWLYKNTYKKITGDAGDYQQAAAFARAGFDGWPLAASSRVPTARVKYVGCADCGKSVTQNLRSNWPHKAWNYIWW